MNQNPYLGIPGLPPPSTKDHTPYIEQIAFAADFISKRERIPCRIAEPFADLIIYTSFLISETEWWVATFKRAQALAADLYRDKYDYWRLIQRAVSTPKVEAACLKLSPALRRYKYFAQLHNSPQRKHDQPHAAPTPKKTATVRPLLRRGLKWKLDHRWEELSTLDRKIFFEGCRRAQIPKREDDFTWAELGVESLSKKTFASPWHVKRSRFHLCELGLWARIKRGYKDQGSSKYYILITPRMADAYFAKLRGKGKRRGT